MSDYISLNQYLAVLLLIQEEEIDFESKLFNWRCVLMLENRAAGF